jgi:hypothetical protein
MALEPEMKGSRRGGGIILDHGAAAAYVAIPSRAEA